MTCRYFAPLLISLLSLSAVAQQIKILPSTTDKVILDIHGPHLISTPLAKTHKNKLVIAIPGTGSGSEAFAKFDSVATAEGFHTISLDYKNEVITTACLYSNDSTCYDSFRQEIGFGTQVSDTVKVDSVNSIYNRIDKVLKYLVKKFPSDGWQNFYKNNKIQWQNISIAGHSQGAGHAAYFGKIYKLDKVIILSGPQDYLSNFKMPALWISRKTATPSNRYFALLHYHDPFDFQKQLASCLKLSATLKKDTINAQGKLAPKHNILVTHVVHKNPHGSVLALIHVADWKYLLNQ